MKIVLLPMIIEIDSAIVKVTHEYVSNVHLSNIVQKQIFKWSQGDNDQICHAFRETVSEIYNQMDM